MKLQKVVLVLMGMMLLLAGRSSAQDVKTDYDRNANFGQYKTYSWEQIKTKDPLMVDRIKSAVNGALAAKGFMEVPSGGDISIVAMETTQNQQSLDTFYNGFGGGWRWGGFGDATTTTENYKVGTLVVDLFDTNTKKLVWRGSASDTLSNKSEKNIDNLDKGVEKSLRNSLQNRRNNACPLRCVRPVGGTQERIAKRRGSSFESPKFRGWAWQTSMGLSEHLAGLLSSQSSRVRRSK